MMFEFIPSKSEELRFLIGKVRLIIIHENEESSLS